MFEIDEIDANTLVTLDENTATSFVYLVQFALSAVSLWLALVMKLPFFINQPILFVVLPAVYIFFILWGTVSVESLWEKNKGQATIIEKRCFGLLPVMTVIPFSDIDEITFASWDRHHSRNPCDPPPDEIRFRYMVALELKSERRVLLQAYSTLTCPLDEIQQIKEFFGPVRQYQ